MAYSIDKIKRILEKQYDMNTIQIEKNEESSEGNVYIVNEKYTKFVLKIYTNKQHAVRMVKLYNYLNTNGIESPHIIKNKSNESICCLKDNEYFVVQTFINGNALENISNNSVQKIARYLKKLHNISRNNIILPDIPFDIKSGRNAILHFDTTKNNILEENENIVFIDFDDAKYGPAICDIAIAVTNLFISRAYGVNIDGINMFLDSYYGDDDELRKREIPLIGKAASCWIKYVLENNNFSSSTEQGLENKYYWINNIDFRYKATLNVTSQPK